MNKIRIKFVIYSALSVFVMLAVLLTVINVINFTMSAQDADRVTAMIAAEDGRLKEPKEDAQLDGRTGPMGPESPEMRRSVRYYTYRFSKNGESEQVAYNITAVDEKTAAKTAASLLDEKTGWINTTYRYRVYRHDGYDYVTVIDFGRELLPAFRVLTISVIGAAVSVALSVLFLLAVGKKLFEPLEEAERKQKSFIKEAGTAVKVPLTVIGADTELIERRYGSSDETKSIRRQLKKLTELEKQLKSADLIDDESVTVCDLSEIVTSVSDSKSAAFEEKGIRFTLDAAPAVNVAGDAEMLREAVSEIIDNQLKFAQNEAAVRLSTENGAAILTATNGTDLPDGRPEQIFDRFTRLQNSIDKPGNGLGLSYVKDAVKAHNGRYDAFVSDKVFTLRITL